MRKAIFTLCLFLSLSAQAQDIDFLFTAGGYTQIIHRRVLDTITQVLSWKTDTVRPQQQPIFTIRKAGNEITFGNALRTSEVNYQQRIRFDYVNKAGTTVVYQAVTQEKEMIYINPLQGWAIIIYKACAGPGMRQGDCDIAAHFFGPAPLRTSPPD